MTLEGALMREQDVTFAIVVVKPHVVQSGFSARDAIRAFQAVFWGVPIVLMAQDRRGTPNYFGRRDLVRFMCSVPLECVPWKRYSFS